MLSTITFTQMFYIQGREYLVKNGSRYMVFSVISKLIPCFSYILRDGGECL